MSKTTLERRVVILRPGAAEAEEYDVRFPSDALPDTLFQMICQDDQARAEVIRINYKGKLVYAFVDEDGWSRGLKRNDLMRPHYPRPIVGVTVILLNGGMW